ncbi:hypothetical protein BB558_004341 [Smittium angustum]|uniref:ASTRA-associated protein 1 n=1 Tax=Smittium angustum TaxID=133377 RepID=A0A2U1J3L2_SMIAN|nr:hypothetical protein BB558_006555 [Smittium angustum]PVZ99628.1 hypothetical protein BB558_004341 [Smittium angustum]
MKSNNDPLFVFRWHSSPVNAANFFSQHLFVTGDQEGNIIVWSTILKKRYATLLKAHSDSIICVYGVLLNNNIYIISQGRDNLIKIWKLTTQEFTGDLSLEDSFHVDSLCFTLFSVTESKTTKYVAALSNTDDNTVLIYDILNRKTVLVSLGKSTRHPSNDKNAMCTSLKILFISEGIFGLVCGNEDGSLAYYQLNIESKNYKLLNDIQINNDTILSVAMNNKKSIISFGGASKQITLINFDENLGIGSVFGTIETQNQGIGSLVFSNDDSVLAVGCWDYRVRLYDVKKLEYITKLKYHSGAISMVSFYPGINTVENHENHKDSTLLRVSNTKKSNNRSQPWLIVSSHDCRVSMWSKTIP